MNGKSLSIAICASMGIAISLAGYASATLEETVLHSFSGDKAGSTDGGYPSEGSLVEGADGNFYGVTVQGAEHGDGTVFMITPTGTEMVLHSFSGRLNHGSTDGGEPLGSLVQPADGKFYGVTYTGGEYGSGVVYRMSPTGSRTILHTFPSPNSGSGDGGFPSGSLARGRDGNFYGTTGDGGEYGDGVVFTMTLSGTETVLHSFSGDFAGSNDGGRPGSLARGTDGNFYGMTFAGGEYGYGTVFMITPTGSEILLHSFSGNAAGSTDGGLPLGGLVQGTDGNFYGMTQLGGEYGYGVVFQITPTGTETVLHSFSGMKAGSTDGGYPWGNLVQGINGDLYGMTYEGGKYGFGTIFQITPTGTESVLYSFSGLKAGSTDGGQPTGSLLLGSDGNFYGTTNSGGEYGYGVVFKLVL